MNYTEDYEMIACPCCGNFTICDEHEEILIDTCEVCHWQYDWVAQKYPDKAIGPNHGLSLNQARKNYLKYGAKSKNFIDHVREPLAEELPENQ